MWRGSLREGADETERRGGLIYEEESTATQGRAENGRVKAHGGAGRVVGVAGVRGGQAADKVGAGMKNGWMGESFSHRQERG